MDRHLRIACLQTRPRPDFAAALDEALGLAGAAVADGAQVLALPEHCGEIGLEDGALSSPAVPESGHPVLAGLAGFAAGHKVWILIGSLAVTGPESRVVNRGFLIDPDGRIRCRHDRIQSNDAKLPDRESDRSGTSIAPAVADTPFGRIGLTFGDDLRFPQIHRALAQAGAEILVAPAAVTDRIGEETRRVLIRARAIENGAFVIAPGAVGPIDGGACHGPSLVVGPWGDVIAEGGDGAGLVHATLDLDDVAAVRAKIPSLAGDRPYRISVTPDRLAS